MRLFIGKMVRSESARIEHHTGRPLTDEWMSAFSAPRNPAPQPPLTANQHNHQPHERVHAHHDEKKNVTRYRVAGRAVRLHETSRFVREGGRWFYVDGDLHG